MHPMAVRAFIMTAISPDGREKLRAYEKRSFKDQPGRYLVGFEMMLLLKNPPKNPSDQDIQKMESLWYEYERTQMGAGRRLEEEHPEVTARTKLEEVWAWEDYAVNQYLHWINTPAAPQLVGTPAGMPEQKQRRDLD